MDISNDGKILAVGGNDNSCAVWSIQDLIQPELKYCLGHQAAVKAVAFCPWSTTLLATGGGSKDRTIRFWHTNSGTLLHKMNTKSQITALVWSRSKKQLVATFGFGNTVDPLLLMVYSYPNLKPLSKVTGSPNLRALSTISSPDFKSICVAANDQNVRFYKVWSSEPRAIPEYSESSMLGSEIIELSEGIDKQREIIR